MSVADILAAARTGKSAEAGPAAESPAADSEAPQKPVAEKKPAAAAGAKPAGAMSVADIMAAARAAKAGGEAAAPAAKAEKPAPKAAPAAKAEKPAPAKPAKEAAPAKAAADKGGAVDTSSILAAARGGGKPGPVSKSEAMVKPAAEVKSKPVVPPMPEKPAYVMPRPAPVATDEDEFTRRGFAGFFFGSFMATGFTTLALTHLLWLLGLARFMFPNILTEPPSKFRVGKKENFAPGMVENKFKAQFGVWIVNSEYEGEQQIFALKTVCTHLGCTPNWLEAEQKFKCPCHGSGFYKDGINFEGPAPRPLERYAIRATDDGQLEVDKSKLFFEEKGQWKEPASFVPV
jgi:cytochrome b6-f complex iron-sulfur subunit